jgi:hypothetical protein
MLRAALEDTEACRSSRTALGEIDALYWRPGAPYAGHTISAARGLAPSG